MTSKRDYIRDGAEIYRRSFATIRAESDLARFTAAEERIAVRIIHASGLVETARYIQFDPRFPTAARDALGKGAPILCDSKMVANGITKARLPAQSEIVCTLDHPAVASLAERLENTRSAAAVELWRPRLDGAVAIFGNAPTALFHLLDMLDEGAPLPAAIIGMPVGFVGAAEAKEALAGYGIPYAVVTGRRGGSAMAAAALNAVASDQE